jgi:hypothetical protein
MPASAAPAATARPSDDKMNDLLARAELVPLFS